MTVISNIRLVDQANSYPITSFTLDATRTDVMTGEVVAVVASGLTAARTYVFSNNNSTTASINLSAEL